MPRTPSQRSPGGRASVLIHRKAVQLKRNTATSQVPNAMARALIETCRALAEGRPVTDFKRIRRRRPYSRVKAPPDRAMVRFVEGDLMVWLVRERDDFYRAAERLSTGITRARFTDLDGPEEVTSLSERVSEPAAGRPWDTYSDEDLCRLDGMDTGRLARLRKIEDADELNTPHIAAAFGEDLALILYLLGADPDSYGPRLHSGHRLTLENLESAEEELAEAISSGLLDEDFVAVDDREELQRILSGSMAEWMVFLLPSQRNLVEAHYNGPAQVRGGPGSGKTVVALHRAIELARSAPSSKLVLLTTYVKNLPKHWKQDLLPRIDPALATKVRAEHIDKLISEWCGDQDVVDNHPRRETWVRQAIASEMQLAGVSPNEVLDEFDYVIAASLVPDSDGRVRPVRTLADYEQLPNRSGSFSVGGQTAALWSVWQRYEVFLRENRLTDYAHRRLEALERVSPRFAGVVVDESQDLSPVAIEILRRLDASPDNAGFMLVGDARQQIYRGGLSLRAMGIEVRGRSTVLTRGWRTSRQTAKLADAIGAHAAPAMLDDGETGRADNAAPGHDGPVPELWIVDSETDALKIIAERLKRDAAGAGRRPLSSYAVLAYSNDHVRACEQTLRRAGVDVNAMARQEASEGVAVGTFARAKGREFQDVFVIGVSTKSWPPAHIEDGDEDGRERSRRALFVAVTRARGQVVLVSAGEPTRVLEEALRRGVIKRVDRSGR